MSKLILQRAEICELNSDHHTVLTEIVIEAPKAAVWQVLTDFATMPRWSPSFKGIKGLLETGANVTTIFDLGEGDEDFSATLMVEDGVSFGWSENYDGITDAHHYRVEAIIPAQTRFVQTDTFKGTADWASTAELADTYCAQYATFNRALKQEVEARLAHAG